MKEIKNYLIHEREACHGAYNGGHNEDNTQQAFHHGMDTVFNCLEGYMAKEIIARSDHDSIIEKLKKENTDLHAIFKHYGGQGVMTELKDLKNNILDKIEKGLPEEKRTIKEIKTPYPLATYYEEKAHDQCLQSVKALIKEIREGQK